MPRHCERDGNTENCDIEITPEMLESGMAEYKGRWCDLADADDNAARDMLSAAFRSMFEAKMKCVCED